MARATHSPVDGDGHEREDGGADGQHRDELADLAVQGSEGPVAVQHVRVVEGDVQGGDHSVRDGQVHQEVIGNCAHPLVGQNYPDDDEVAARGHHDHASEQQ